MTLDPAVRFLLNRIKVGCLTISFPGGRSERFGNASDPHQATLRISDNEFFRRVRRRGSLGLGESYVDGQWDVDDDRLCEFLGIILLNFPPGSGAGLLTRISEFARNLLGGPTSAAASKRNAAHHYDVGNDLYELFLDEEMGYSCGYLVSPSDTLAQMQENKFRLVCEKAGIEAGDRTILDIGCGWGGLLRYVERKYDGVRGLGVTLSEQQQLWASGRFGSSERFRVELADYRSVTGAFDYVVSVGMFEHVGKPGHGTFMRKVAELLKPGGRGLLHTMGVTAPPSVPPDPWISRYVFPGHRLPRLEEIVADMRQHGLLVGHVENLQTHYAETFRRWRLNFRAVQAQVLSLGRYDERFVRLWNYYLQSCEAGFRFGSMQLYQVAFAKGRAWSFPAGFPRGFARGSQ